MGIWDRFKKQKDQTDILENGWQFYHVPTTLEPVGTVFRINKDKVRFIVKNFQIKSQLGNEAPVRITKSSDTGLGLLVKFLEIVVSGKLKASKNEKIEFELKNPEREITTDDNEQEIFSQLSDIKFLEDNKYYIIRECRFATGMNYRLSKQSLIDIGGEAQINNTIKGKAEIKRLSESTFEIPQEFSEKMRVMFLPLEITPPDITKFEQFDTDKKTGFSFSRKYEARHVADEPNLSTIDSGVRALSKKRTFKLIPVTSQLEWEDSSN